ncbi:ATP-binding protein [Acidimangrovimonas pyrenivorans]|uniref:histidine kinase n=1 Tax=Acidimangrovimonas pyrenivorans TaxID=2030798 RepID=A0ABV7AE27_9RHOB
MKPRWPRRLPPRSLYGRAALILIVPIVTIQLVVSVVFIQRHFEGVTRQMTNNIVIEMSYLLRQVNAAGSLAAAREKLSALQGPLEMTVVLPADGPVGEHRWFYDLSGRQVVRTLHKRFGDVRGVDLTSDRGLVTVLLGTRYGPMRVTFIRDRVTASNPHQLLVLMILTSVLMTVIAYFFLRRQLRPITKLASAAEEFGKGRSVPYRPRGANEVRAAGRAFVDMRARIERQIEQRTLMLSGVSHDLRTPLTRLKLDLSMLDDQEAAGPMLRDVDDMERLLDGFLAFARDEATEAPEETDPVALVSQTVENARRAGHEVALVSVEAPEGATAMLRPRAAARALENLVGNAARHGSRVEVRLVVTERMVRIVVEDDGPGIPPERREEALRPFTRLDAARNQDGGGGVGLGLAIAADTARIHGGSLNLGQSESLGGLKAELLLAR